MKITFKKIMLQNFLSFRIVSLDIANLGIVRVNGENLDDSNANSNDAGKTNFFNGLTWILYEKLAKLGDGKVGNEVVNQQAKEGCLGMLTLDVDGKEYIIRRYRKHEEFGDKVFVDGLGSGVGKRAATNEEIVRLIGMTYEMFLRAVFWAQSTTVKRLTQLTDSEYKSLFDEIVGTAYCSDKAARAIKLRRQVVDEMEVYRKKIIFIEQAVQEREALVGSTCVIVSPKEIIRLEAWYNALTDLNKEGEAIQNKRQTLENSLSIVAQKIIASRTNLHSVKASVKQSKDGLAKNLCSVCGQELKVSSAITKVKKQAAEFTQEAKQVTSDLTALEKEHDKKSSELVELAQKLDVLVKKAVELKTKIDQVSDEPLAVLQDRVKLSDKMDEYKAQIVRYKEDVVRCHQYIAKLGERHKKLFLLERAYGSAGIRVLRLMDLTPLLNQYADEYSNILVDGVLKVEFSTTSELKNGEVRESYKIKVSKQDTEVRLVGGGMRRRADLIAACALCSAWEAQSSRQVNIKVYDEATDGLDADGELSFVSMLRDQCPGTTFFVSQKSLVGDALFDRILTVRRQNGISELANATV